MVAQSSGATAASRIYLVLEVSAGAAELLDAALARVPLACLMLVPPAGTNLTATTVRPLVEAAQKRHCAVLLLDDAALARTLRADGVHLSCSADLLARFAEARSILGGGAIVGADVGTSRHLAMELGEAGADYIGFSDRHDADAAPVEAPDNDLDDDTDPGPRSRDELVAWWSEVFEVPCIAVDASTTDEVRLLAEAGADFITCFLTRGVHHDAITELLALHDAARSA